MGFGWNADELADHGVPASRRRAVLREYLEAMRALWSQDEAAYAGEYVRFEAAWAWPKPAQARIKVLLGAAGTERTFHWIARSADGWMTTPGEADLEAKVALLHRLWRQAGRDGLPEVTVLAGRPDPGLLARWNRVGITAVACGLPDRGEHEVVGYISKLGALLGLIPAAAQ